MKIKIPKDLFAFGYNHSDYDVRVLNERETRAASGLLFVFSLFGFSIAWFTGNFSILQYFITFFVLDFTIRVFVNPRYSPSLIVGRIIVSKQVPEYTGAKQKRFAWASGCGNKRFGGTLKLSDKCRYIFDTADLYELMVFLRIS